MNQQEFWHEVAEERKGIAAILSKPGAKYDGQPKYDEHLLHKTYGLGGTVKVDDFNAVYVVSKKNRDKGVTAGAVMIATVKLAGQRIVEETHEVATADQIAEYLAIQAERRKQQQQEVDESKLRIKFVDAAQSISPSAA